MELIFYKGDTTMFQDKVLVCKDCGQSSLLRQASRRSMLKKAFKTNPLIAGIAEQSGKGSQGKEFSTKLYVQAAANRYNTLRS